MEAWGTLGARPQLGYGLFRITNPDAVPESFPWEAHGSSAIGSLPDLRTFIFFKLRFTPREATWWTQVSGIRELRSQPDLWSILERLAEHGMVPVAPAIKNYLRFELAWSSVSLKRWLFGTLEGNVRIRSKVSLSWAYRLDHGDEWEIRGWVYVPQDATGRYAREEIAQTLQRALEHPQSWFRAIGLDAGYRYPAEVTIMPAPALVSGQTWRLQTTSQIATFLSSLPAAR
jgi:CRISPR-associated protein Cmr1